MTWLAVLYMKSQLCAELSSDNLHVATLANPMHVSNLASKGLTTLHAVYLQLCCAPLEIGFISVSEADVAESMQHGKNM